MNKRKGMFKKGNLTVTVPEIARKLHLILLEKMEKAQQLSNGSKYNFIKDFGGNQGIIASGAAYNYAREAIDDLGIQCKILKIGMSYPIPDEKILKFLKTCKRIIVIEELEGFLEDHIKIIATDNNIKTKIYGKGFGGLKRYHEYNSDIVSIALAQFFDIKKEITNEKTETTPRPPVLCPGCPHRATYYAIKQVAPKNTIYPTDIGCYTLGLLPPYKTADFLLCMGSSIGSACGFAYATNQKVVAFIGDSTFYHAGLPPLVNGIHHDHDFVAVILDNSTTAMTGHQPHPGSTLDGMGDKAIPINIEKVVKGLGVQHIEVIDPRNLKDAKEGIKRALDYKGLSVVISKAPCILLEKKAKQVIFRINQETCKKCKTCILKFTCPAFYFDDDSVKINPSLCAGCGVCVQVCPFGAIEVSQ